MENSEVYIVTSIVNKMVRRGRMIYFDFKKDTNIKCNYLYQRTRSLLEDGKCSQAPLEDDKCYLFYHVIDTMRYLYSGCDIYMTKMVFDATFNTILVISWRSILFVKETGIPGENQRQKVTAKLLSHNVVPSTPFHGRDSNSQLLND